MRIHGGAFNSRRLSTSFAPPSSYHPFSCPHLDFAVERSFYRRYVSGTDRAPVGHKAHAQHNGHCGSDLTAREAASSHDEVFSEEDLAMKTDGYVRFSRTDISTDNNSLASKTAASSLAASESTTDCQLKVEPSSYNPPHVPMTPDYEYPAMVPACNRPRQLSVTPTVDQVVLPRRKDKKLNRRRNKTVASSSSNRARCIYCQELYFVAENGRGACPDAPDDCAACIERATCLCAARALLYHCATDEDGSYGPVCGIIDSSPSGSAASSPSERRRRRRKWILLAFLSVVLPCLWCYPALAACHSCAVRHGHCGARHRPV